MAALMIETDSLSKFGLTDFTLGLILMATNVFIVGVAVFIGRER